jgi:hypothetical protein
VAPLHVGHIVENMVQAVGLYERLGFVMRTRSGAAPS